MTDQINEPRAGRRGPADHVIRGQIVTAAYDYFSHYGYGKTTVSDLAKAIGFSKAYIYKFFDSKQAIGEAICWQSLSAIAEEVRTSVAAQATATAQLRALFTTITTASVKLFFNDRNLYEIAVHSATERWQSNATYSAQLLEMLQAILLAGRQSGEFERKTPLDESARAILSALEPYINPLMLQHNLDRVPTAPNELCSLALRSLAP